MLDIKRLINDEGVADHTALLPTKSRALVDFESLPPKERKVLELIYQNFEEATSEPYRYEKTTVTISYRGEIFTATGVRNLELGWKKNRPNEIKENVLPGFQKGEKINIESVFVEKRQTEPPDHFSDGRLLQAMEVAGKDSSKQETEYIGIGTAATRSEIIKKLIDDGFVKRTTGGNSTPYFVPTDLKAGKPTQIEYFFDKATYDKYVDRTTGKFDARALSEALQVKPYQIHWICSCDKTHITS